MATGSPSDHPPPIQNDHQLQHNQSPPHSQTLEPPISTQSPAEIQDSQQSDDDGQQSEQKDDHPLGKTLDSPISPRSPAGIQNSQQSDDDGQQSEQKDDHPPGKTQHITLSEPIVLTDDTENPSPQSLTSRNNKRKKPPPRKTYKRKRPTKKIISLTNTLNPLPFVPFQTLDLDKHEEVLKKIGLYEFSKIEFDRILKTDLIVQLIGNYDPKKRCSYVNDSRIGVNRADLARALKLPPAKQDRGGGGVEEVDLDSEVFSDESIEFIEDFVSNWILLRDEPRVVSGEMVSWARCIRDGHPEKMDPASLIWNRVEKELTQGDKLDDCYYASHLLYLIRSQKPDFFVEDGNDDDGVGVGVGVADDVEELVKADEEKVEEYYEIEEKTEKEEKEQDEGKEKESMVQEQNLELNLETEVEEPALEEVTKDNEAMADADVEEQVDVNDVTGDHFLQPCRNNSLVNFEEVKVEEVEDEHIEEVEDEQIEQVDDEEDEEEQEGDERMDEGFDMEANDDSFDRDGLTDNFLQGVETSHNPYNSHGMSSMDLFGSRDGLFMSPGGPSYYNNGGKRVMEPEEDIQMQNDIQNSKRIKTDEIWDQKQNDIGFCFDQIQQLMQKAKMIHESKERTYENMQYSQQIAVNEFQERQQIMEMIIKSKDEELEKKHKEVFRLEREIYLMTDLLSGYRKALNDTRSKFSEYRKRFQLKEEPLYRDAGPGGLVLSVREFEKQRLKQEEDMMKIKIIAKNFEEECIYQLEMSYKRLSPLFDKLVVMENEVQILKEIAPKPKETQVEPSAELAPSVEAEENQKFANDVQMLKEIAQKPKETQVEPSAELAPSVEAEENQKLVNEVELSVEPEKVQKLMVEDESSVEPEKSMDEDGKNLKLVDEDESLVEAKKNQEALDKITENDASKDGVLPDAAESEEKAGGEEDR